MSDDAFDRPLSVTMLGVGVLILMVFYLTRLIGSIAQWQILTELSIPGAPLYLLISGVVWSVLLLIWGAGLWWGHPLARRAGLAVLPAWTAFFIIERLAFTQLTGPSSSDTFWITACLLFCAWGMWTLLRKRTRQYFEYYL